MSGAAAVLVREVQRRIDDAQAVADGLDAKRAAVALDAARGVPAAVLRMEELREQAAAARAVISDLAIALTPALELACAEQDAADDEARRSQYQRAVLIAQMRLRASERVDKLAAELAASMLLHDALAVIAHGTSRRVTGEEASRLVTAACADTVLGQLVRHQAIPREHLPANHMGETNFVGLVAEAARRHLAMLATHAPTATRKAMTT
jgi:hypothetical protein